MKVSSSELPPRQVVLEIEVDQERVDRSMEQAYRRIANRVNVPGFRKGKAPRALVERTVGRSSILEDALEHLAPEVVNEAIEQEGVKPYARPGIELLELEPLKVKATIPLAPRVELGDYKTQLRIAPETVEVAPEQVDSVVERLRESYAQWVPVERPARLGDRVGIDVRGEVVETGRVLMDSKDAEYVMDPDGPQPAAGFADEIVEMEPGDEKSFTLSLAEDYRDRSLAGQAVAFAVRLHWVKEKQLPDVDAAFAQQAGEYADVAALREAIERQIREREEERVRAANERATLDKLVEISTIEVPPQLVEHQAEHMYETFAANLQRQGLEVEQYLRFAGKDPEGFRGELRQEAEERVKRTLALDAFTNAEPVDVGAEEVEAEVKRAAAGTENPEAAASAALANDETRSRVVDAVRERRAIERLIEMATSDGRSGGRSGAGKARKKAAAAGGAPDTETIPQGEPVETVSAEEAERQ